MRYLRTMDNESRASGDQRRRALLEILREPPLTSRALADRPPTAPQGVSCGRLRRLRVARPLDAHQQAQRPTYSLQRPERLADRDAWSGGARALWQSRLDTLHIEIANGRKTRR
jgi:hypothetical protein